MNDSEGKLIEFDYRASIGGYAKKIVSVED